MIIYADSLFMVNFFMDSVLMYITALSLRRIIKPIRLILGATFLSLYGTVVFLLDINIVLSVILKFVSVIIGIIISFGFEKHIKNSIMFLVVSGLSGGIVYALAIYTDYGVIMNTSVSNGTFYLNINPLILLAGSGLIYLSVWFLRRVYIKNYSRERLIEEIRFIYGGKEYIVNCLVDTGCSLTEPLSGEPLMIIDKGILLPKSCAEIAVNTVNGKSKMRLIFPENIEAANKDIVLSNKTPIAISGNKISADDIYNGIINPDAIINNRKEGIKCQVF